MAVSPWMVSDELWELAQQLLPRTQRRFPYPGRKRLDDRAALQGILFVLRTGIAWRHLPGTRLRVRLDVLPADGGVSGGRRVGEAACASA